MTKQGARKEMQVEHPRGNAMVGQGQPAGWQRMSNNSTERSAVHSSPDLTVFCFNLWLHMGNLRPQVLRHPCDLILDDKLVYVFVAKRKLELWKH